MTTTFILLQFHEKLPSSNRFFVILKARRAKSFILRTQREEIGVADSEYDLRFLNF
jgi:hypothetical protein